jgi:hypothetical protein
MRGRKLSCSVVQLICSLLLLAGYAWCGSALTYTECHWGWHRYNSGWGRQGKPILADTIAMPLFLGEAQGLVLVCHSMLHCLTRPSQYVGWYISSSCGGATHSGGRHSNAFVLGGAARACLSAILGSNALHVCPLSHHIVSGVPHGY